MNILSHENVETTLERVRQHDCSQNEVCQAWNPDFAVRGTFIAGANNNSTALGLWNTPHIL